MWKSVRDEGDGEAYTADRKLLVIYRTKYPKDFCPEGYAAEYEIKADDERVWHEFFDDDQAGLEAAVEQCMRLRG